MKEQLVTFETAKLAKEKEILFNELFPFNYTCYNVDGVLKNTDVIEFSNIIQSNIPTQSLLHTWLRDEHNILIVVRPNDKKIGEEKWENQGLSVIVYHYDENSILVNQYNKTLV